MRSFTISASTSPRWPLLAAPLGPAVLLELAALFEAAARAAACLCFAGIRLAFPLGSVA